MFLLTCFSLHAKFVVGFLAFTYVTIKELHSAMLAVIWEIFVFNALFSLTCNRIWDLLKQWSLKSHTCVRVSLFLVFMLLKFIHVNTQESSPPPSSYTMIDLNDPVCCLDLFIPGWDWVLKLLGLHMKDDVWDHHPLSWVGSMAALRVLAAEVGAQTAWG